MPAWRDSVDVDRGDCDADDIAWSPLIVHAHIRCRGYESMRRIDYGGSYNKGRYFHEIGPSRCRGENHPRAHQMSQAQRGSHVGQFKAAIQQLLAGRRGDHSDSTDTKVLGQVLAKTQIACRGCAPRHCRVGGEIVSQTLE